MAGKVGRPWLRLSIPLIIAGFGKPSPHVGLAVDASLADEVLALDIQSEAVLRTRRKTAGLHNVEVREADHAELARWVERPAEIIVFNFGYLPYSSSPLITTPKTTLPALDAAVSVLKPEGLLSLACYRGHAGGLEEWQAIVEWIERLDPTWHVRSYTDGRPLAPVLYHLRRI